MLLCPCQEYSGPFVHIEAYKKATIATFMKKAHKATYIKSEILEQLVLQIAYIHFRCRGLELDFRPLRPLAHPRLAKNVRPHLQTMVQFGQHDEAINLIESYLCGFARFSIILNRRYKIYVCSKLHQTSKQPPTWLPSWSSVAQLASASDCYPLHSLDGTSGGWKFEPFRGR